MDSFYCWVWIIIMTDLSSLIINCSLISILPHRLGLFVCLPLYCLPHFVSALLICLLPRVCRLCWILHLALLSLSLLGFSRTARQPLTVTVRSYIFSISNIPPRERFLLFFAE